MRAPLLFLSAVLLTACTAQGESTDDPTSQTTAELTSGPDLVETTVSDPPPTLRLGDTFAISDTAQNNGDGPANASTTAFYLSTNNVAPLNKVLKLNAVRSVPSLGIGANSMGTTSQTLPGGVADGSYYVVACADYNNAIGETIESNNCSVSTASVLVSSPDLVETAVSNPPSTISLTQSFSVTDTVQNNGTGAAVASQTVYYLSTTATAPYNKVLRFGTTRAVGALLATGSTSTGSVTLTVPAATSGAAWASGTFYVVACADYTNVVAESNENNNCGASGTAMQINAPDLAVTAATEPPADVVLGAPFSITDTVTNSGTATAGASTTVFYLSSTNTYPYNYVLRFAATRSVPSLTVGSASSAPTSLVAPAGYNASAAFLGTFYLVACADFGGVVSESNETNNCHASTGTVFVHGPDLVESLVSMSPTSVDASGSLTFGDTTTDLNTTASPASEVGYMITTDNVHYGILSPCTSTGGSYSTRSVPALAGGASSAGSKTITGLCIDDGTSVHIPAPGTYTVLVCADIYNTVFETAEYNNCAKIASTLTIGSSCGNGILEAGEQCDDHNNTNGDGCSASCQLQTLTSVTVASSPTAGVTTVHKGLTQQYAATANYSDGWTQDVSASATWATGSSTVATISTSGLLKAVDLGTTTVQATWSSMTGSTNVTVDAAVVVGLVITPPSPSIAQFTQQQFAATAVFSDATTQDVTASVTWSSATTSVATIASTGLATALGVTTTSTSVIGASYAASSGTFTDSTTLSVTNATLSTITVTPADITLAAGATQQYAATGNFSDGTSQDITAQVGWSTLKFCSGCTTNMASINPATGVATASTNHTGVLYVVATAKSPLPTTVSGQTTLTVSNATLQSLAVIPSSATVPKGFSQQFTATATYSTGTTTFTSDVTKSVTWSSSNTGVAQFSTPSTKGLATSQGSGTATITATLTVNGVTKSGTATFTGNNAVLTSIAITPSSFTLAKGNSQQLTATGTFNDSGVISTFDITTQVSWTSSDKTIARPNKAGSVKASKAGTATITATSGNVQGTATVTVN